MSVVCEAASAGCGGCDMLGVPYTEQVEVRRGILEAAFQRAFARMSESPSADQPVVECRRRRCIETTPLPPITVVTGSEWGYRSRVQLTDGGFQKRHTNERITVHHCPVATEEVNAYLEAGTKSNGRVMVFGDKRVVKPTSRSSSANQPVVECFLTPSCSATLDKKCIETTHATPPDDTAVCVKLCGREVRFDVRGFFQSNLEMLERTIPLVCGGLAGHNVLDMYAGCGTFSTFLADSFSMVTLVEKDAISVAFAEANLRGRAHRSFALSGERWVKYHADEVQFDAAVVDPPRAGLEKAVVRYLIDRKVPVVRYLSCCAATHARDCAALVQGGYVLEDLTLLDFYPQTHRTESLATLRWGR